MGITGNLKTMVLAELLQWLSQGTKTGTLVIDSGTVEKKIYFRDGTIISSASTAQSEHLGNFLVLHGYLDEETLTRAVAQQKTEKKLIGQVLVDMGVISQEDLEQMLRFKAEESIYDVFTWEQGDFEFLDGKLPEESMVPMNLDVQWIVLEGSRRVDEMIRIREQVPSSMCVPVSVSDLAQVELEEEEHRSILSWIDDDRTVEEISEASHASVFQVTQVLAVQVLAGTVKVVRPRIVEVRSEKPQDSDTPTPQPVFTQAIPMPAYPQGYMPPMQAPGHPVTMGSHPSFPSAPPAPATPAPTAPARPKSEAEKVIVEADRLLEQGKLDEALATYRQAGQTEGADAAKDAIRDGEEKVRAALDASGVKLTSVPRLSCDLTSLTQLKISPQEGFMLTRINGSYDIKSLLKMNPAPQLETQMLFWRLRKSGHVAF